MDFFKIQAFGKGACPVNKWFLKGKCAVYCACIFRDTTCMKKKILYLLAVIVFLGVIGGISYYLAVSGGGEIDINGRIRATDQSNFVEPVLENTRSEVPNGGLRPRGGAETPAPPAPPSEAPPATTTEQIASSTEEVASSTEAGE